MANGPADPWNESASIRGASNIAIQDICPGRDVEHFQALFDAAYFAVVMDALTHRGAADASRVDRSVCLQDAMSGVDAAAARQRTAELYRDFNIRVSEHHVTAEPPLATYARGKG